MTARLQRNTTARQNLLAKLAAPMAVTAILVIGGTLAATGNAEARTCVPLFDGFQICLDGDQFVTPDPIRAPVDEYVQTIRITTRNGSTERLVQSFRRHSVRPGLTRVCLINHKGGLRSLVHGVSNINPLRAQSRGSTCANFPSNARVTFVPYTNSDRARPAKKLVYSLSRYDGGMLNLSWK